ncbi:cathepsin S-like [Limulus polyphemus]|uniref:Cathepsin S-like n=1 Tax=Limulus polyphemus TaxID=6850 RepID=A0ABM1RZT2_LIMPO|nr:cathepsin S-like [Limulus polyphemus]
MISKMFHIVIPITLVTSVVAASFHTDLDQQWTNFKSVYKKQYDVKEEGVRRLVFEENVARIAKHNLEADLGIQAYQLGLNIYADLTSEEFVKQIVGFRRFNQTRKIKDAFISPRNVMIPDEVDWRDKKVVTEVKDQGSEYYSWTFSVTGSVEGQHALKTGKLVSLSEEHLQDCCPNCTIFYDESLIDCGFQCIIDNKGIDREGCFMCKKLYNGLSELRIVAVGGIYNDSSCSSSILNHEMLIVGYGVENGKDYWLVKNSWGKSWGEEGYIKMSRNMNNQCGIATLASYPTV